MAQLVAPESRLSTSTITTIPEQNQPFSAAAPKGSRRSASPQVSPERVNDFVEEILGDFGMGLSETHIDSPQRRDRLLLMAAMAQALLTLLGAAGEACGLDRTLKANTVKTRTMSLYNQGCCWYRAIPTMPQERLIPLMKAFGEILSSHAAFREIFGLI